MRTCPSLKRAHTPAKSPPASWLTWAPSTASSATPSAASTTARTTCSVAYQVKAALSGIDASKLRRCIIAYEPSWAIGTGKTATAEQAQEVCQGIRAVIRGIYGARPARAVSILYGGSMNAKNAAELLAQPDIDGGLIGGASLKPVDFATIIKATDQE